MVAQELPGSREDTRPAYRGITLSRAPNSERWLSGRKRSPAKGVYVNSVSRVRIPLSPPDIKTPAQAGFFMSGGERGLKRILFDKLRQQLGPPQAPRRGRNASRNRVLNLRGPVYLSLLLLAEDCPGQSFTSISFGENRRSGSINKRRHTTLLGLAVLLIHKA